MKETEDGNEDSPACHVTQEELAEAFRAKSAPVAPPPSLIPAAEAKSRQNGSAAAAAAAELIKAATLAIQERVDKQKPVLTPAKERQAPEKLDWRSAHRAPQGPDDDPLAFFFEPCEEPAKPSSSPRAAENNQARTAKRQGRSRSESGSPERRRLVEDFISENGLDAKCAQALRSVSSKLGKQVVLDGFNVRQCQNPSAVVMSRIRRAEGGQARGRGSNAPRGAEPRRSRSRARRRGRRRRREEKRDRRSRSESREKSNGSGS